MSANTGLSARILHLYSLYTVLTVDQVVGALNVGRLEAHSALSHLVDTGRVTCDRRARSVYRPRLHTAYHRAAA